MTRNVLGNVHHVFSAGWLFSKMFIIMSFFCDSSHFLPMSQALHHFTGKTLRVWACRLQRLSRNISFPNLSRCRFAKQTLRYAFLNLIVGTIEPSSILLFPPIILSSTVNPMFYTLALNIVYSFRLWTNDFWWWQL